MSWSSTFPKSGVQNLFKMLRNSLKCIAFYLSSKNLKNFPIKRGSGRLLVCLVKLFINTSDAEKMEPMRTIYLLGVYNRNFLAHVLIIERIMATVFVGSYEQKRNWLFSALWSPIVVRQNQTEQN